MATGTAMPCTHHWVIQAPEGGEQQGECKLCGERRVFRPMFEQQWDNDGGPGKSIFIPYMNQHLKGQSSL